MNDTKTGGITIGKFVAKTTPTRDQIMRVAYERIREREYRPLWDTKVLVSLSQVLLTTILPIVRNSQRGTILKNENDIYMVPFFKNETNDVVIDDFTFALIGCTVYEDPVLIGIMLVSNPVVSAANYHFYLPRKKKWKCDLDQWLRKAASGKWESLK